MIVASGYVEANTEADVEKVVNGLKAKNVEVNGVNGEKVVFLIERETMGDVKADMDALHKVDGVRSVYLSYYSLEGADEEA
ncbi:MAG: chaperone NapD [Nitrospirae bacterium]|nr:chaperone NapD [Nitrospirota bacterium]